MGALTPVSQQSSFQFFPPNNLPVNLIPRLRSKNKLTHWAFSHPVFHFVGYINVPCSLVKPLLWTADLEGRLSSGLHGGSFRKLNPQCAHNLHRAWDPSMRSCTQHWGAAAGAGGYRPGAQRRPAHTCNQVPSPDRTSHATCQMDYTCHQRETSSCSPTSGLWSRRKSLPCHSCSLTGETWQKQDQSSVFSEMGTIRLRKRGC